MRPAALLPLLFIPGCYLSHERPTFVDAATVDAGVRDASIPDVVDLPALERRIPGILPELGWDGDEVALIALPGTFDERVLHRFSPSLADARAPIALGTQLLGGAAWRSDRFGLCGYERTDPVFREYSLDGTTMLSERPLRCDAVAPWGDSWAVVLSDVDEAHVGVGRIGGTMLDLGEPGHPSAYQPSIATVGEDVVFAVITEPELDLVVVRLGPDGTVRARYRFYGIRAWYAALAAAPDGEIAVLVDTSVSRNTLELLRLGPDLAPLGPPVIVATEHEGAAPPRIASFDGGWAVTWVGLDWSDVSTGPVAFEWLDRSGAPLGERRVLADDVVYGSLALLVAEGAAYVVHDASSDAEHPELVLRRLPAPR